MNNFHHVADCWQWLFLLSTQLLSDPRLTCWIRLLLYLFCCVTPLTPHFSAMSVKFSWFLFLHQKSLNLPPGVLAVNQSGRNVISTPSLQKHKCLMSLFDSIMLTSISLRYYIWWCLNVKCFYPHVWHFCSPPIPTDWYQTVNNWLLSVFIRWTIYWMFVHTVGCYAYMVTIKNVCFW